MFSLLLRNAHLQHVGHGGWAGRWHGAVLGQLREGEHGQPSFSLSVFTLVDAGFFSYLHFSSPLSSCDCAGSVWSSVHTSLHLLFLSVVAHSIFFLNLIFWFSFLPILLGKTHRMCLFLSFLFPFFFPFSQLFPFHSIGTREVVTQKNLSGLVPIRDLRLDPSLLCSIPLLALSPNLLIVWLFLSIAYLVTKLRCK